MNPQRRKHFVILVHHGSQKRTREALSSFLDCQMPPDKIIVIDHAKQPYHATQHDLCHIIRPQQNNGYAAGINIGLGVLIALSVEEDDIIIVANNDITVDPLALQKLRKWWQDNPADALLGTGIREDGKTLSGTRCVDLLTGRTHLHSKDSSVVVKSTSRFNTKLNYIHGAFFSAPYKVFLQAKGMPESYFLYWEDVLFSHKVKQAGVPLLTTDIINITHQQHKNKKVSRDHLYYLVRNGALFLEKETPTPWRQYWWIFNRLRFIYHTIRSHRDPVVKLALRDAIRGVTGPITKTTTNQP